MCSPTRRGRLAAISNFFKLFQMTDNKSNNGLADEYGKRRPRCSLQRKAQEVYPGSFDYFAVPCSFGVLGRQGGRPRALWRQLDPGERGPSGRRLRRPTPMENKDKLIIIHSNMICIALTTTISVLKYFLTVSASVAGSSTMYWRLGGGGATTGPVGRVGLGRPWPAAAVGSSTWNLTCGRRPPPCRK